jgi:hypothetical protein
MKITAASLVVVASLLAGAVALTSCKKSGAPEETSQSSPSSGFQQSDSQPNPERNAYFGETHVHTSWSFDAFIFGNHITGPADAYQYFKGTPIKHPLGYDIKIETPLDWAGVTDHSEYVGTVRLSNDPSSPISKLPIAKQLEVHDAADIQRIYLWLGTAMITGKPVKELLVPTIVHTVWDDNNKAADAANQPGKFTAFCSYEWTSTPDYRNLHRNVFFKDCAKVPDAPFSSVDSPIQKTYGTGWTASVRQATSCWPSRTTRILATATCIRSMLTVTGGLSMRHGRLPVTAMRSW